MDQRVVLFSAVKEDLPMTRTGEVLKSISFKTCPGSNLVLSFVDFNGSAGTDKHGMYDDAWWVVRCQGLPDRYMRMTEGACSMRALLRRYGFQDASGCIHHRDIEATYELVADGGSRRGESMTLLPVPERLRDATGVPQFHLRSGVCWYATMLWITFSNEAVSAFVCSFLPADVQTLCLRCVHDRTAAEALRAELSKRWKVGDPVEQPDWAPEMDGRNGFTEFLVLCANVGIPIVRYVESNGELVEAASTVANRDGQKLELKRPVQRTQQHFLVIRFQDGDHQKHPVMRRVECNGCRYRLVGLYMGRRQCGHQIGMAFHSMHWRDMSFSDADLHKDGIGPIFIKFGGDPNMWWDSLKHVAHVTKFGAGNNTMCLINPHNPGDDEYQYQGVGSTSIDVLYLRDVDEGK